MMKNTISMNVSAIGTDDGKSTFEVQRTWNEKGKKAIAIGMYPTISVENCGMLDVSNMHLLNHANDFGWGELRMLNLYATVVNGKPSVSQLQGNSLAYIEEILETKDIKTYDIVVAWGNSMATHKNTIKAKIDLLSMLMEKGLSSLPHTLDMISHYTFFTTFARIFTFFNCDLFKCAYICNNISDSIFCLQITFYFI